jgi:hypothetical protein
MSNALSIALRFLKDRPAEKQLPEREEKGEKEDKGIPEGGFPCLYPFSSLSTDEKTAEPSDAGQSEEGGFPCLYPFSSLSTPDTSPADEFAVLLPNICQGCMADLDGLICASCGWRLCDHCKMRPTASRDHQFCELCGPPESEQLKAWNRACIERAIAKRDSHRRGSR